MKIAGENLRKIATGLYASKGMCGLVIDIFAFTELDRTADENAIAEELQKRLSEYASDKVECLVFKDSENWDTYSVKNIALDHARLSSIFKSLNTLVLSSEATIENSPESIRIIDSENLSKIAKSYAEKGDAARAEYCFEWSSAVNFIAGTLNYANFLAKSERDAEAEVKYKKIAKKIPYVTEGAPEANYAYMLDRQMRYTEAMDLFRFVLSYGDGAPAEGVEGYILKKLENDEHPYWSLLDPNEFLLCLNSIIEHTDINVEKVLRSRLSSDDLSHKEHAKKTLAMIYATGKYLHGDLLEPILISKEADLDKLKALVPDVIESADELKSLIGEIYEEFVVNVRPKKEEELARLLATAIMSLN